MVEKRRPAELLDELGIDEPHEIDLDGIAAYCGAYVVYEPLRGSDARIVGSRDKAIITINSNALPSRQRFSIGHWMRDRGNMVLSCSAEVQDRRWSGVDSETLANRFASELLMPAEMLRDRAKARPATMDIVIDLASQFRSSLTATAIRMVECGSFPCMVFSHSSSGREWFFGSPERSGPVV